MVNSCILLILMLAITTKESRWHSQNSGCGTECTIQVSSSENCKKQGPTESSISWVPGVFPKSEAAGV